MTAPQKTRRPKRKVRRRTPDEYVPHVRDVEGKLVPAIAKPAADRAQLLATIKAMQAELRRAPGRAARTIFDVDAVTWNAYIAAAPRCGCGMVLAPRLARLPRARHCSDACREKQIKRAEARRRRQKSKETRAFAEALYQWA